MLFAIVGRCCRRHGRAAAPVQPGPAGRVLDNVDLMDLMLKPAYDELQRAMAAPPADRMAWAALYQKAARLAETENLLFFRTRAGESTASGMGWTGRSGSRRVGGGGRGGVARPPQRADGGLRGGPRTRFRPCQPAAPLAIAHSREKRP